MPSKTSKDSRPANPPWKAERGCSEEQVQFLARVLARELAPGDRVLLEGPMGAGKTTFARELLRALGVEQPPEGSPSFAIVHEYESPKGPVAHMDFYRIRDESEIDEAGIPAYFWERELIVITEWLANWKGFEKAVLKSGRIWRVEFSPESDPNRRALTLLKG